MEVREMRQSVEGMGDYGAAGFRALQLYRVWRFFAISQRRVLEKSEVNIGGV